MKDNKVTFVIPPRVTQAYAEVVPGLIQYAPMELLKALQTAGDNAVKSNDATVAENILIVTKMVQDVTKAVFE